MTDKKQEVKAGTSKLTNNTKGLRGVAGIKVLPGETVEVTREQVVLINKNPCAMSWVKCGDLTLV